MLFTFMGMTAETYIRHLHLQPHPEGGFYKETYRSQGRIAAACLPGGFTGDRSFSTSIYYLLQQGDFSTFHRIRSDEGWHFYAGGTLLVHVLEPGGNYTCHRLGRRIAEGEQFQLVVPAGAWFAAEPAPETDFALVGCTVAPGFDFADFELARREPLQQEFPGQHDLVGRLCRQ
ncbi:cupin domain-containing protein [Paraflavisolibacter sp. H34]|uniref:cupin domain-containing protein n=1 Tax=Huijunlia imazamoxiresistens TaxID=3127457 RepID=UPI0030167E2A